jgi:FG-GAP-like repeat/FG-GAP repeat
MSFRTSWAAKADGFVFVCCRSLFGARTADHLTRLVNVAILLGTLTAPTRAGFITAPTFPAGDSPAAVAIGDFNRDGILDLVVANPDSTSGTVSILLGNGDGTFQDPKAYAAGPAPCSVAVGDLNGDGVLDLAVVNCVDSGTVSVLLGKGDGTFQAPQSYPVGSFPNFVALGDLDGNGTTDLVVANGNSGFVSVLLGNGDGSFQHAPDVAVGGGLAGSAAIGDFNGDGHLDLAVAIGNLSGMVNILLGNGDGTFGPAHNYTGTAAAFVAVGDLNGDGVLDLVVSAGYDSTLSILLGNGDGTFGAAQSYSVGLQPRSLVVADLNGDGNLDLAVANRKSNTVSILLGNGDGTFRDEPVSYAIPPYPQSITVGDLDGDGHLDLAVADGSGVTILRGQGDGTFYPARRDYAVGPDPSSIVVADWDGNGILDLAVANPVAGTVSILLGQGDGTFRAAPTITAGSYPASVAVGDFNGDGHIDLVVANFGTAPDNQGTVSILLGNGDGRFQAAQTYHAGIASAFVAVGDFNGDGVLDLAVANGGIYPDYQGTFSVLLGNGDGTFQPAQTYPAGRGSVAVAVGDFNGDGLLDLAIANHGSDTGYQGSVTLLLGNGDGTFQAALTIDEGQGPTSLVVGDINGDGKLDIVTANFASYIHGGHPSYPVTVENDVRVMLGNGDGTFQPARTYPVPGGNALCVALGDFNKDGIPDLAVAAAAGFFANTALDILLGNGDGTFQSAQGFTAGIGNASFVATGDFNGDSYADLVVVNRVSPGTVTVLINAADWGGGP